MTRVGGQRERERARLAEGKAEIWRSSCSIQLESSREIGRGRKRSTCVCVRMCTCVQGVLLFLAPGGGCSILCENFFFHLQIFQVSFYKVKLELKSPFSCCDWRLKNFIKGGRLGGCKKINFVTHYTILNFPFLLLFHQSSKIRTKEKFLRFGISFYKIINS